MTTTLHGLGTVDESLEGSLKMLGMHGSVYANKIVQESDLIVGIGNRFDDRTIGNPKFFGKNAKDNFGIYHIDISQNNIDLVKKIVSPTGSFHMDSNLFFNKLIPFLKFNKNRKKWINHINMYKKKYPLYKKDSKELRCEDILQGLSKKIIGHDFYITTGVGSHQMKVAQHILWNRPNTMISSGSLGTMGVGLPFAIGTHFATPNSTIFCIDGDGSMMMSIQELATIAEYQIPIKILLMNDNSLQMVESWQNIFYKNNIVATNLKNPNFKQLAKSFGIKSIECSSLTSLSKTLDKILSTNEPIFCEFKIKKNFCFPFVKPNHSLDSIMVE
jgi:acetolactate synthase-1/2/3 large subunit